MATSVTINGGSVVGDIAIIDCTVAGVHQSVRFDAKALDALPSLAVKQDFIARQAIAQANQTLPTTSPDPKLALTGTYTPGGTTVVVNGMVRQPNGMVVVDATVGGAHQTALFHYEDMERVFKAGGATAVQTFVAQQMKGASAATVNTAPLFGKTDLRGTLSI